MILVAAMALGAAIGAVAGALVYTAKVALSNEQTWHWKDALAAVGGGVVGGGLFPPLMMGLAAIGLPATASYVAAGGLAWGGLWALAEEAARWGLGRADGLGSPGRYAKVTGIGLAASALLLPAAARVIERGGLVPHSGRADAYVAPSTPVNAAKAEGEFLVYGATAEAGDKATTLSVRAVTDRSRDEPEVEPEPEPPEMESSRAQALLAQPTPEEVRAQARAEAPPRRDEARRKGLAGALR